MNKRYHIHIDGIVQGVGFRPFIYRIAKQHKLTGFVYNHSRGVEIEAQGYYIKLDHFKNSIISEKPPLSQIDNLISKEIELVPDEKSFEIIESVKSDKAKTLLPPDIATCDDCVNELFDPEDRRYSYPFINCMNCGPRYTIIHSIPYDRKNTTMNKFPLCDDCHKEYTDPIYRRFHAEPNACEKCGPALTLLDRNGKVLDGDDEIKETINLLKQGYIVAIKSLCGFHLCCDAENTEAIRKLRERKKRPEKPFAVMSFDLDKVKRYSYLNEKEEELITSPQRPIVLLRKKPDSSLSDEIAPNNNYIGVMLAYNPIQLLLLKEDFLSLVMTSGNISEEPICIDNEEAVNKLKGIADAFLINDRDINTRVDDSIAFVENNKNQYIRRARGYVPYPISYIDELDNILALGGELKNTIAFSRGKQIFPGQHIGDLKNIESYNFFKDSINHMSKLLDLNFDKIAYDKHPDYLSTQYAQELKEEGFKLYDIQHHKAHIASCIADNGLSPDQNIIGIALDGTGYGEDDTIWGGEIFTGNLYALKRRLRIRPIKMPGGQKAVEEPYRMAISYIKEYLGDIPKDIPFYDTHKQKIPLINTILDKNINTPLTSSTGRLFDAVSSLIGIKDRISFEAQAAIGLQMVSEQKLDDIYSINSYPIKIHHKDSILELNFQELFEELINDIRKKEEKSFMGIKFHKSICDALLDACKLISYEIGTNIIILSGGVFQNRILLKYLVDRLEANKFKALTHRNIPCNDAGISTGQILLANYQNNTKIQ